LIAYNSNILQIHMELPPRKIIVFLQDHNFVGKLAWILWWEILPQTTCIFWIIFWFLLLFFFY